MWPMGLLLKLKCNFISYVCDIGDDIKKHDFGRYYKLYGVMFCNDTYIHCVEQYVESDEETIQLCRVCYIGNLLIVI